jgi:hypothetical protein
MDLKETMDKRVAEGGGSPHLPRGGWRRFLASPLPYSKMAARRFEFFGSRVERKTGKDFAHAPSSAAGYLCGWQMGTQNFSTLSRGAGRVFFNNYFRSKNNKIQKMAKTTILVSHFQWMGETRL